jgi:protease I
VSSAAKRIGVVVDDDYQELEFWYLVLRFREMGAAVTVIGADGARIYRSRLGYPVLPDKGIAEARAADFDAIILPGGVSSKDGGAAGVTELLKAAWQGGAVLAALSSGVNVLGAAGLVNGAGAESVTANGRLVTGRSVDDIPVFAKALLAALDAA